MRLTETTKSLHVGAYLKNIGQVRHTAKYIDRPEIETILEESGFFKEAPFSSVTITLIYGKKNNLKLEYMGIDQVIGDISVSLELGMDLLIWADKNQPDMLDSFFAIPILEALIQIGEKYSLPTEALEAEREKYGKLPSSVGECIYNVFVKEPKDSKKPKEAKNSKFFKCWEGGKKAPKRTNKSTKKPDSK